MHETETVADEDCTVKPAMVPMLPMVGYPISDHQPAAAPGRSINSENVDGYRNLKFQYG